jgi:vitellogenic carboxypeptidase-like protein
LYFFYNILEVAADFYIALEQLYNNENGCFHSKNLNIPGSSPLFIFGESYAGKYVPAISKKIV